MNTSGCWVEANFYNAAVATIQRQSSDTAKRQRDDDCPIKSAEGKLVLQKHQAKQRALWLTRAVVCRTADKLSKLNLIIILTTDSIDNMIANKTNECRNQHQHQQKQQKHQAAAATPDAGCCGNIRSSSPDAFTTGTPLIRFIKFKVM